MPPSSDNNKANGSSSDNNNGKPVRSIEDLMKIMTVAKEEDQDGSARHGRFVIVLLVCLCVDLV